MLGKTFEKDIKYDQFTSPDEAYLHPFLSQSKRKYKIRNLLILLKKLM